MTREVLAQEVNFDKKVIETSFKKLDSKAKYSANRIIYYPYYFFSYNVKAKRIFQPMDEKIGCTIDAVSGRGSLIDNQPCFKSMEIFENQTLNEEYSFDECVSFSETFIYRSISLKMRMISFSNIEVEKDQFFYRPYWIVSDQGNNSRPDFIVDGVTGQYHPL